MTITTYTYSIANDTLNGKVDSSSLYDEINQSEITIALSTINTSDDNLYIIMKDELSTEDETILNTIVSNHTGIAKVIPHVYAISEVKDGVQGYYQTRAEVLNIPANSSDSFTMTWPYPVRILSSKFKAANDGDEIYGTIGQNTVIGALTNDVNIGDKVFNVSDTVIENLHYGFILSLLNTSTGQNEDFLVVSIDSVAKTVTVNAPAENDYSAAAPTYCRMTVSFGYTKIPLKGDEMCLCGVDALGGSLIKENVPFKIEYWNNSDAEVTIYFEVSYWY